MFKFPRIPFPIKALPMALDESFTPAEAIGKIVFKINEIIGNIETLFNDKVDKNQGTEKAGYYLIVDADGYVKAIDRSGQVVDWGDIGGNIASQTDLINLLNEKINLNDVVDNLTSTATDAPLSANQGRVLNDNKVNISDIVDNLTSTDIDKPLSANQGRVLNNNKVNVSDVVDNLTSTDIDKPLSANQGRVLNNNKVNVSDVVDNLTSTDIDKPLSANQGRVLNNNKVNVNQGIEKAGYFLKVGLDGRVVAVSSSGTTIQWGDLTGSIASQTDLMNLLNAKIDISNIVDNLTSTATDKPLSANQGKILNDTKVNKTDIVNNLTDTATDKPLSANQGRILNDTKINQIIVENQGSYTPNSGYYVLAQSDNSGNIIKILLVTKPEYKQENLIPVNNLSSTDTDKPLSANQGKILNDTKSNTPLPTISPHVVGHTLLEGGGNDTSIRATGINPSNVLQKSSVVDNLTSTATDAPLSANQGKVLNDTKENNAINSGDVIRVHATIAGIITGDSKNLSLRYCFNKPITATSVSVKGIVTPRTIDGYVYIGGASQNLNIESMPSGTTFSAEIISSAGGGVYLNFSNPSKWLNQSNAVIKNNTPVVFTTDADLIFTFS